MIVTIHRGTKEIGGTCIVVESASGARIVLDLGLPITLPRTYKLPPGRDLGALRVLGEDGVLPQVPGLYGEGEPPLAILISHPHMDHYGLVRFADPKIPCVTGRDSRLLMDRAGAIVHPRVVLPPDRGLGELSDRKALDIGPFRVTPYLVDHSAFDAYALLVEADGKRLFYSGDFRGHGRKGRLFEKLLKQPPGDLDVLLMEGTTLGGGGRGLPSEQAVEGALEALFKREKGFGLLVFSAQNLDRFVSVYKAARSARRTLLIDPYTAWVLEALKAHGTLPQSGWSGIRLFRFARLDAWMRRLRLGEVLDRYRAREVSPAEVEADPGRYVAMFRNTMIADYEPLASVQGCFLAWGLWEGYLKDPSFDAFHAFLKRKSVRMTPVHTSGHATPEDLKRFAQALAPKRLVPIHSFRPDVFVQALPGVRVTREKDGVAFPV